LENKYLATSEHEFESQMGCEVLTAWMFSLQMQQMELEVE
jgi:hypothetical protein